MPVNLTHFSAFTKILLLVCFQLFYRNGILCAHQLFLNLENWMAKTTQLHIRNWIRNNVTDLALLEVKKWHYFKVLKNFQEKQEKDMSIVRYLVGPGDTVVDIGANLGIYTQLLSKLTGPSGEVIGIEAVPTTFGILAFNINRLKYGNVRLLNFAVSDSDGTVQMEIPDYRGFYRSRVVDSDGNEGDSHPSNYSIQVPSRKLNTLLLRRNSTIAFIKCDVEGHELHCINGADEIIDSDSPPWLIEIGDNPDIEGSKGKKLFRFFDNRGYQVYWFDGDRLKQRVVGDASINYFFLKPYHIDLMMGRGMPYPLIR